MQSSCQFRISVVMCSFVIFKVQDFITRFLSFTVYVLQKFLASWLFYFYELYSLSLQKMLTVITFAPTATGALLMPDFELFKD